MLAIDQSSPIIVVRTQFIGKLVTINLSGLHLKKKISAEYSFEGKDSLDCKVCSLRLIFVKLQFLMDRFGDGGGDGDGDGDHDSDSKTLMDSNCDIMRAEIH